MKHNFASWFFFLQYYFFYRFWFACFFDSQRIMLLGFVWRTEFLLFAELGKRRCSGPIPKKKNKTKNTNRPLYMWTMIWNMLLMQRNGRIKSWLAGFELQRNQFMLLFGFVSFFFLLFACKLLENWDGIGVRLLGCWSAASDGSFDKKFLGQKSERDWKRLSKVDNEVVVLSICYRSCIDGDGLVPTISKEKKR